MSIKKIENGRAAYAYEAVEDFVAKNENEKSLKEYRSYIKKIPAMIQVNGLGQTLAFLYAKGGVYKVIYKQIKEWMQKEQKGLWEKYDSTLSEDFVKVVINMASPDYRIITMETFALLSWMRRFAEGMINS